LSLSSLMSHADALCVRSLRTPIGSNTRVFRDPPFAASSPGTAARQPESAPKVPGATRAIKATKPPQEAWPDGRDQKRNDCQASASAVTRWTALLFGRHRSADEIGNVLTALAAAGKARMVIRSDTGDRLAEISTATGA
jgi:hypothetical protein